MLRKATPKPLVFGFIYSSFTVMIVYFTDMLSQTLFKNCCF